MKVRAQVIDLQHDGFSWSANGCWSRDAVVDVDDTASDLAIARKVKAALSIQGMRTDGWSGASWSWRHGAIGAWAEVID